jgi:hypothetical protein
VSLTTILICAGGAVAILLVSDGKTEQAWAHRAGIKPSVLLSACNAVGNLALSLAIAEAVAIAWWRKALKGSTVQELHRSWSFSSSVKEILLAGSTFNVIALAALAAKIAIADGILLQRATSTYSGLQPENEQKTVNITGGILDTIPTGFTGQFADNTARIGSLTHDFASIVRLWSTSPGQLLDNYFYSAAGNPGSQGLLSTNCVGQCTTSVIGAGFSVSCSSDKTTVDYGADATEWMTNHTFSPQYPVFATNFSFVMSTEEKNYTHIQMSVLYVNSSTEVADGSTCPGTLKQRTCELQPAKVSYPIYVTGQYQTQADYDDIFSRAAIAGAGNGPSPGVVMAASESDMLTQWGAATAPDWDDTQDQLAGFDVAELVEAQEPLPDTDVHSTYGGIALALSNIYSTTANISMTTRAGWSMAQEGQTSQVWIPPPTEGALFCNYTISDPTSYIVRQLNKIMLTTSIYAASQTGLSEDLSKDIWNTSKDKLQKHLAVQTQTVVFYATNRAYMWAALSTMLLCITCVAPAYYGYWQLGRKVALGPMEIANAFRAPVLEHPTASNGELPILLKEVGDRKVQYGVMNVEPAGRLAIADTEMVEKPSKSSSTQRQ